MESLAKKSVLVVVLCITGLILYFAHDDAIGIHIFAFLLLCFSAACLVHFDILHPYVWYSSVFALYSISYPLLYKLNIVTQYPYSKDLILLQWLALSTFLITVPIQRQVYTFNFCIKKTKILNKLLANVILTIVLASVAMIATGNYTHKNEIYANANLLVRLSFSLAIVLTVIFIFQFINSYVQTKKIDYQLLVIVFLALLLLALFSGERDILFRFVLITILLLYALKKIRLIHVFIIAPSLLLLLPLSSAFKYFFLSGQRAQTNDLQSFKSILGRILDGEFISASKNLQLLINHSHETEGIFKGFTIFNDFVRIFRSTEFTHGRWFHDTFFPHVDTPRYGFTLVGQGYINWGPIGVIVVFLIIGVLMRFLYLHSIKNLYAFVAYIFSIPTYMYAIRADLANILSPFLKHLIFTLFFIWILQSIYVERMPFQKQKGSSS